MELSEAEKIRRQRISVGCKRSGVGKWMVGRKPTQETLQKRSLSLKGKNLGKRRPDIEGRRNLNWKGDKVSYRNLHRWIERHLGKANKCMNNLEHQAKRYHWANISQEYKREFSDFRMLCASCNLKERRIAK